MSTPKGPAAALTQFTGFAISTLIQKGKISLTDDIRKYPGKSIKKAVQTIELNGAWKINFYG
jgi:hypothetical protein